MRTCRLLLIFLSFSLATCQAAEITLEPSKDNTIYEDSTNLSNGQGVHLFSGATANRIVRRALLAFEVDGSVPAGAAITDVTLGMRVNKVSRRNAVTNDLSLHRVLQDWGEGTSDASGTEGRGGPASQGDATWEESIRGIIVGSDIPELRPTHVARAFRLLGDHDWVFGPAADGGYWLLGARRRRPPRGTFADVRWSSAHALADTLANLKGARVAYLEMLGDVDTGEDLARLRTADRRQPKC